MRYLSICSGIEAATVAWHPLGWRPWAFAEVDAFPSSVLAHHYPTVPNLGDMTRFQEWPDATFDVLVGGTPCQSFSVAGLRKGLADPRGNLMLTFGAIAARYRPEWVVWENVPGVLSSGGGRDFGALLGMLGELGYGVAYRVLDAQYFGLAQRRKRVFVVGCLGGWRRAAAVLFERASLRGDPAPRREAREIGSCTLAGGARDRGGYSTDDIPLIDPTIKARDYKGPSSDGDGDGDGDGAPLIVHAFDARQSDVIQYGDRTGPLDTNGHTMAVAFDIYNQAEDGDVTHTLKAQGDLPHVMTVEARFARNGRGAPSDMVTPLVAVALHENQRAEITINDTVGALNSGGGKPGQGYAAVAFAQNQTGEVRVGGTVGTLNTNSNASGRNTPMVSHLMQVRRLTPRECERLQGFPDDYTLIPHRGKPAADGPRYKALGNSMAVPVMQWIGKRIAMVDEVTRARI